MYRIDPPEVSPQLFPPVVQVTALQAFLSDAEIETICRQLGHVSRSRLLTPDAEGTLPYFGVGFWANLRRIPRPEPARHSRLWRRRVPLLSLPSSLSFLQ
jgi:hypothetical protein